jgi:hypothetical protein
MTETVKIIQGDKLRALLCISLFFLAACFETSFQDEGVKQGYLVTTTKTNENAAVMEAAGEFRIVAANVLWGKVVDHYHHQYMAEGGNWAKNESLLPILRTITQLDPHFVQAYELMGGSILPNTGHVAEGHTILLEGIKNNPNEWELYREIALLAARTEHQPATALQFARVGLTQTNDQFSYHLMKRLCNTLQDLVNTPVGPKKT